jgi:hypothetical protein
VVTIQDWGAIGEIVGAIAVVISLVYLATQLRMNTRALRANASWNAETIFGDTNYMLAREPELAELMARATVAEAKPEDFTDNELIRVHFAVRGVLQYMQAQYSLRKEGALSDAYWQRRRKWTCSFIGLPVTNPVWKAEIEQQLVDPDFQKEIELGLQEDLVRLNIGKNAVDA